METLKLTDQEQRAYSDLFQLCDSECTGKISWTRALELFRASGLPPDIQQQIAELCGAQRLGHFGRSQFYVALKLIAVAQCGLPLKFEVFSQGTDIPLPKFAQLPDFATEVRKPQNPIDRNGTTVQPGVGVQIPPPPTKQHVRSLSGSRNIPLQTTNEAVTIQSGPHTVHHIQNSKELNPGLPGEPLEIQQRQPSDSSPKVSSESSSKSDVAWASFEEMNDEDQGLLGTGKGEDRQWANFQDGSGSKAETSSVSSTCSDAESEADIWTVTDEQREYYVNQFRTMQSDLNGVISGAVAKEFFEKSRLPLHELSKIWQLSDMNRDGALSLEEFCTAMHLVVLRRNEIELPDHLPPSLMPYTPLSDEPFAADLPPGSTLKRLTPSSPQPNQWILSQLDSQSSSAMSSPGTKPLQFDFKPVTDDGKIAHPVALRMSPDGQAVIVDDKIRTFSDPTTLYDVTDERDFTMEKSPTKQRSYTEVMSETGPEIQQPPLAKLSVPLQSRPRPTPKKPQSGTIQIAPPPSAGVPLVPPRKDGGVSGGATHSKRLVTQKSEPLITGAIETEAAVAVIPSREAGGDVVEESPGYQRSMSADAGQIIQERLNIAQGDAETSRIPEVPDNGATGADKIDGAPERPQETVLEPPSYLSSLRNAGKDKKDIQAAIRLQKERNTMLSRLNSELNQELQEVMEQRIALEIQLEHLKPFSSGH